MSDINLETLSQNDLDDIMRAMGAQFDEFAHSLAKGSIDELAPPFRDYHDMKGDIVTFYDSFFQKYLGYLEKFSDETWEIVNYSMQAFIEHYSPNNVSVEFNLYDECKQVVRAIIEATVYYFKGAPNMAFEVMQKTFTANNCHLLNILPQMIVYKGNYFRVRGERDLKNRKELFHTPFEMRTRCGSYRFSILGYPSLYLASSLETALKETRISDSNYSACRYNTKEENVFVDLTLPNRDLAFYERYSLVLFYPLIVACGLKLKEPDHEFKPEYVIPQIFFQIVSQHSTLDGVAYTSTRYENPCFTNIKQRNFVFIIRDAEKEKGQSEKLAVKLKATEPISPDEDDDIESMERKLRAMESVAIEIGDRQDL